MKDTQNLRSYSVPDALSFARRFAGHDYSEQLEVVLTVAMGDKRNLPSLRIIKPIIPLDEYIEKWVLAYLRGYKNRPSVRVGKRSETVPDSIIKEILKMRINTVNDSQADEIEGGHSLSMTIENMVGDLLEEYLSIKLADYNWYCCWGSTIDAVDFCKRDGSLLQVKTSDNSENSSSSRVREGTDIKKWFRRFSTRENAYNWAALNRMIGNSIFSEDDFKSFVNRTVTSNPNCIYVDPHSPLVSANNG
jgi:hypothetical protein